MDIRRVMARGLCSVPVLALIACAGQPTREKSAADVTDAQPPASGGDVRACYDEPGHQRADAPYADCRAPSQDDPIEQRRSAPPAGSLTVDATPGRTQVPADAVTGPTSTVVRPAARVVPPPGPGIGETRIPVPVPGGMRVLR